MPLSPGSRLGVYAVTAKIGQGGMGEVYRARDTKLNRDVALKVLPDLFASDPDRLTRFEREAQVLASLNHPNIGAIYGLEESEGVQALALELIEGPTLADRIAQGPIPVDEAVAIARQIADALEAAHEQGIIHRDLKPANIKLKDDGSVKVLDFGLAKALEGEAGGDPSQSPTLTAAATQAGVIMGTAAYMAPEQAKGKVADKRADIWSFGVVLLEMLTGQRVFSGESISETLAAVMMREPDLEHLPPDLPSKLSNLVRRCLQKDPRERIRDVGDIRLAMEGAFETTQPAPANTVVPPMHVWQRRLVIGIIAAAALVVGSLMTLFYRPSTTTRVSRFAVSAPALATGGLSTPLAISPDGRTLAYVTSEEGTRQLYLRRLDQLEPTVLRGTEGAEGPVFSPDGEWVAFWTVPPEGLLKKVSLNGGPPLTLTRVNNFRWADWGPDGTIVFAGTGQHAGLWVVADSGGEPRQITPVDEEGAQRYVDPQFTPDGNGILFTIVSGAFRQVAAYSIQENVYRILTDGSSARVTASGHLVFARDDSLWAVPFETERLELLGEPSPVLEGVQANTDLIARFALGDDGSLVYVPGASGGVELALVWVDREGRETPAASELRDYRGVRLSPEGDRAAMVVRDNEGTEDVLIYDLARDIPTRFTFSRASDSFPVWSPDGQRLIFSSLREGARNLFWKAADGTGDANRLTTADVEQYSSSWSPDGETLVIADQHSETGFDIALVSLSDDGQAEAEPLLQTEFSEYYPEISPDGRWMAYASDESGQVEIYVRPFPDVESGRWLVSRGTGNWPLWSPNGQELYYRRFGDLAMMVIPIETDPVFRPGNPEVLFDASEYLPTGGPRAFDVAPDGSRFLMVKQGASADDATTATGQIHVVLNWLSELTERVPKP